MVLHAAQLSLRFALNGLVAPLAHSISNAFVRQSTELLTVGRLFNLEIQQNAIQNGMTQNN